MGNLINYGKIFGCFSTLIDGTMDFPHMHSQSLSFVSVRKAFEKRRQRTANLDFDARVPIPFSVFPSSYRSDAVPEPTLAPERVEEEVNLDRPSHVEREDTRPSAPLPDPRIYGKEEIDLRAQRDSRPVPPPAPQPDQYSVYTEDRYQQQDRFQQEKPYPEVHLARERYQEPTSYPRFQETPKVYDQELSNQLDITERDYRRRVNQQTYDVYNTNASYQQSSVESYENRQPVSYDRTPAHPQLDVSYDKAYQAPTLETYPGSSRSQRQVSVEPVNPPSQVKVLSTTTVVDHPPARKMGYYDDDVSRDGAHHAVRVVEPRSSGRRSADTVPIPCNFIRIGDILILQGRPCQVIRISVSPQTGQHRYLGVDLFTRQLQEESSFVSNPSPSVVVQTMIGPVYKTYRILDIRDNQIVAMTETGDVKQGIPVVPQGELFSKIKAAFEDGHGSVRALVINDGGRELVVDYKVIQSSRL
ncbi:woronin body major protein [Aspergillus flavus]|uniref:Woronin body major protein n=4 Tax=Aspergillus subgen. Circumdati TaxID=2720871 RepID=A0A7U2N305_ASPFN|nr:woronin body major protein [Aspergillus flavus]